MRDNTRQTNKIEIFPRTVDLEPLVEGLEAEGRPPFEMVRVREEGGGLHVYVNGSTDAICERIEAAPEESRRT